LCSRREADKLIETGRVLINGKIAVKGNRVTKDDLVIVDGQKVKQKNKLLYIALYKPPGITCTTDLKDKDNIIDFVNHPKRIFPVGRLDKASSGLILLTNDGDIVNEILREEHQHEKEYIVTVNKPVTSEFLKRMASGIPILGTKTKSCQIKKIASHRFNIILTQGLNRQIRRMCEYLGYTVRTLKRIRIMHITLDKMQSGDWRYLSKEEISILFQKVSKNK